MRHNWQNLFSYERGISLSNNIFHPLETATKMISFSAFIHCFMWQLFLHINPPKFVGETDTTAGVAGVPAHLQKWWRPPIDSRRPSCWPLAVNSWDSGHVTCSSVSWLRHHILPFTLYSFTLRSSRVPISTCSSAQGGSAQLLSVVWWNIWFPSLVALWLSCCKGMMTGSVCQRKNALLLQIAHEE